MVARDMHWAAFSVATVVVLYSLLTVVVNGFCILEISEWLK